MIYQNLTATQLLKLIKPLKDFHAVTVSSYCARTFPAYCVQKIANLAQKTITINGKEYLSTPELEAVLLRLEEKE